MNRSLTVPCALHRYGDGDGDGGGVLCAVCRVQSSKLAIDEIDLFKGVLRWSVAECKRQGKKDTTETKRDILTDIIPLVRFPVMAMEDVATFVSPSQMLSPNQLLEVFTYAPNCRAPHCTTPPPIGSPHRIAVAPL
jgi:hypothetical protein